MRRLVAVLLVLMLCVSMTACKSEAVKNVESLIANLGEISLDSGAVIETAEKAYAELPENDRAKVENHAALVDARGEYEALVEEEEENRQKVEAVKALIDGLGTVTPDSKAAVDEARSAYAALDAALQEQVDNLDVLTAAEERYALLESLTITDWVDVSASDFSGSITYEDWYEMSAGPAYFVLTGHGAAINADMLDFDLVDMDHMYFARYDSERRLESYTQCTDGSILVVRYQFDRGIAQAGYMETEMSAKEYIEALLAAGLLDDYKAVSVNDYYTWLQYLAG